MAQVIHSLYIVHSLDTPQGTLIHSLSVLYKTKIVDNFICSVNNFF